MLWMDEQPLVYERDLSFIQTNYCDLHFREVADSLVLQGILLFFAQVGGKRISDQFKIKISYPKNYPKTYPVTHEIGNRIRDFHINPDNTLCLGSPLELYSVFLAKPCIENYLHNMLIPFLVRYIQYEKTGQVPLGELEHGRRGLRKYLEDLIEIKSESTLKNILELYLMNTADDTMVCPCESGKTFRNCHYSKLIPIQHVPHYLIREHIQEVFT